MANSCSSGDVNFLLEFCFGWESNSACLKISDENSAEKLVCDISVVWVELIDWEIDKIIIM